MIDVRVIGHVTRDVIRDGDETRSAAPGGAAYYTSIALRSLGLEVAVTTRLAEGDRDWLLADLEAAGIRVSVAASERTTAFELAYPGGDAGSRSLKVRAVAAPFSERDAADLSARAVHVGPLMNTDVNTALLRRVSKAVDLVSLSAQGLVREERNGDVIETDWRKKREGLRYVHVLSADVREASLLSGADEPEAAANRLSELGPREVIVTDAGRGSIVLAEGRIHRIPAYPPRREVDATGCGDTYIAGYLYSRLEGRDPEAAGRFGAAVAALKLGARGPFRGSASDVRALLTTPQSG